MPPPEPSSALPVILLAEDNEDDVFFLRRGLEKAGLANPLFVARDGREAVAYLGGDGPYADRSLHPLPSLLLLDIKMPRMNGFDVLDWLNQKPEFNDLAIVMLSSSYLDSDIAKAKGLGADDYRIKASATEDIVRMLHELHARWLTTPRS